MGAKPVKSTPRDMRLKENQKTASAPQPTKSAAKPASKGKSSK